MTAPIPLSCPICRVPLPADAARDAHAVDVAPLVCASCRREFPVLHGIPDLRVGTDPYLTNEEDRAAAAMIVSRFDSLGFADLYASYYEGNAKVTADQVRRFTRGVLAAEARAEATLDAWLRTDAGADPHAPSITMLDLGCGTAPLAIAAARRGWRVIGVDVGLRWLVLAAKRAAEAGVAIDLVCANAEALPIADATIDRVAGESVLENVADQARALAETRRVLQPGGRLWLTTPNRFSIGPDPHLGLPAGGYLPTPLLRAYARRTGSVFPKRHLLSAASVGRRLRAAGFSSPRVSLPDVPDGQRVGLPAWVNRGIDAYHALKRLPIARTALLLVGPTLLVTAARPDRR